MVRCLTPVNVLMFNRQDFHALVGSYEVFRAKMEQDLMAIAQEEEATAKQR